MSTYKSNQYRFWAKDSTIYTLYQMGEGEGL